MAEGAYGACGASFAVGHCAGGLVNADVVDEVVAGVTGAALCSAWTAVETVSYGAACNAGEISGVEVVEIDTDEALAE